MYNALYQGGSPEKSVIKASGDLVKNSFSPQCAYNAILERR